jgi:DNA-binding PadR family transcriptional regulator
MTQATALILKSVVAGYAYGFDIMDVTGLPSGTIYPALRRLEKAGYLRSRWEGQRVADQEGRPRRKLYELTPLGAEAVPMADERLAAARALLDRPLGRERG